jgi:hypothetical protein
MSLHRPRVAVALTALAGAIACMATAGRVAAGPTRASRPSPGNAPGPSASADPAPPAGTSKIAIADQLFAEGKALLGSNLLQACGKFDESLRYNPAAIGTLLNVALCDEKLGRVASAVAKFSEARDRAVEQGLREHVRAAEEHIASLRPSVPHLTIVLAQPVPDTKVLIDDRVIAPDELAGVPVDPGERIIVVSAPDRLPYRTKLVISRAERRDVAIPVLAASVVVESSRRSIGQILTGGGAAAAVAGLSLGIYARGLYNDQFGHQAPGDGKCDDTGQCEPAGQSKTQRARSFGNFGTVLGITGVAVASVGVYLWLTAPSESAGEHLTWLPQLGSDRLGIAAAGRF